MPVPASATRCSPVASAVSTAAPSAACSARASKPGRWRQAHRRAQRRHSREAYGCERLAVPCRCLHRCSLPVPPKADRHIALIGGAFWDSGVVPPESRGRHGGICARSGHPSSSGCRSTRRRSWPGAMCRTGLWRTRYFSPGKSEDPPELSAGSSEPEDLPDPTCGKLSGESRAVNGNPKRDSRNERGFAKATTRHPQRLTARGFRRHDAGIQAAARPRADLPIGFMEATGTPRGFRRHDAGIQAAARPRADLPIGFFGGRKNQPR